MVYRLVVVVDLKNKASQKLYLDEKKTQQLIAAARAPRRAVIT